MPNNWFNFKQFKVWQENSAFKVGTDGVLLGAWSDTEGAERILDVGTGTGLIALMLAQRSEATIVAIEPDPGSAAEARLNALNSKWSERISVIETNLNDFASGSEEKFDLITSNPPYFTNSLLNNNERVSSARHSFSLTIKQLLKLTSGLLTENGRLSLILPYAEGNMLIAEAADNSLYLNKILNIKPLPGKPVKRVLLELSAVKRRLETGFLIIEKGPRHDFTHEYRQLTKEYYLNF